MVVPVMSYFGSRNIDFMPGPAYSSPLVKFRFVFFLNTDDENSLPVGIPLFPSSRELPTACVGEGSFTVSQSVFPRTVILGSVLVIHDPGPVSRVRLELTLKSIAVRICDDHHAPHLAFFPGTFVAVTIGIPKDTVTVSKIVFPLTLVARTVCENTQTFASGLSIDEIPVVGTPICED